jgi:hypothetical protein
MQPVERPRPSGPMHDRHGEPADERRRETGVGHANRAMWVGAVRRALVWGVVGAVIGLAVGLVPWTDVPVALRLGAFTLSGFLGGTAAGFVYGAGRARDLDGEARDETSFAPLDHDESGQGRRD